MFKILLVSMHILGMCELDVSQSPGLDAVPVGRVLEGERPAHDFQGGPGTLCGPEVNVIKRFLLMLRASKLECLILGEHFLSCQ
jgi:hypothetical protein